MRAIAMTVPMMPTNGVDAPLFPIRESFASKPLFYKGLLRSDRSLSGRAFHSLALSAAADICRRGLDANIMPRNPDLGLSRFLLLKVV